MKAFSICIFTYILLICLQFTYSAQPSLNTNNTRPFKTLQTSLVDMSGTSGIVAVGGADSLPNRGMSDGAGAVDVISRRRRFAADGVPDNVYSSGGVIYDPSVHPRARSTLPLDSDDHGRCVGDSCLESSELTPTVPPPDRPSRALPYLYHYSRSGYENLRNYFDRLGVEQTAVERKKTRFKENFGDHIQTLSRNATTREDAREDREMDDNTGDGSDGDPPPHHARRGSSPQPGYTREANHRATTSSFDFDSDDGYHYGRESDYDDHDGYFGDDISDDDYYRYSRRGPRDVTLPYSNQYDPRMNVIGNNGLYQPYPTSTSYRTYSIGKPLPRHSPRDVKYLDGQPIGDEDAIEAIAPVMHSDHPLSEHHKVICDEYALGDSTLQQADHFELDECKRLNQQQSAQDNQDRLPDHANQQPTNVNPSLSNYPLRDDRRFRWGKPLRPSRYSDPTNVESLSTDDNIDTLAFDSLGRDHKMSIMQFSTFLPFLSEDDTSHRSRRRDIYKTREDRLRDACPTCVERVSSRPSREVDQLYSSSRKSSALQSHYTRRHSPESDPDRGQSRWNQAPSSRDKIRWYGRNRGTSGRFGPH